MDTPTAMSTMPLPTPPDFPIEWQSADDAGQLWIHYKNMYRDPITPLDFLLRIRTMNEGLNRGYGAYGIPFVTHERLINSYVYSNAMPDAAIDIGALDGLMRAAEAQVRIQIETLADTWQQTWLPEIQSHVAFWESYDLQQADLPALLAHLTATQERVIRIWEIHNLVMMPTLLALSTFDDLYHALSPTAPPGAAYNLLVGLDNLTTASGRALWQLSRLALTMPEVVEMLLSTKPADVPAQLATTEAGRTFWQALTSYLQTYGKRNELMHLDRPSWQEDLAPVIAYMQTYLRQADTDPERAQQQLIAQREALVATIRQQLSTAAPEQAAQFESAYKDAQTAIALSEDHNHWIEYQTYFYSRQVALAVGQRLVDLGILDTVDDVFYLTLAELYALAQAETQVMAVDGYRNLVQERQRTAQTFAAVTPPPAVGSLVPFPPLSDPLAMSLFKYAGMPVMTPPTPEELRGNPASAGTARGRARIVLSLSEVNKIGPGDILVATVTSSSWTPLFASIGAVVTETGGILSHAAVVAREYHLPAVVGVQGATALIRDGQWLEVDGAAGIVRLLSDE